MKFENNLPKLISLQYKSWLPYPHTTKEPKYLLQFTISIFLVIKGFIFTLGPWDLCLFFHRQMRAKTKVQSFRFPLLYFWYSSPSLLVSRSTSLLLSLSFFLYFPTFINHICRVSRLVTNDHETWRSGQTKSKLLTIIIDMNKPTDTGTLWTLLSPLFIKSSGNSR